MNGKCSYVFQEQIAGPLDQIILIKIIRQNAGGFFVLFCLFWKNKSCKKCPIF